MTDNEIIKKLEDIVKENEYEYYHSNTMSWYADIKSALGVIKRQRAELDRFKKIETTVNGFWDEVMKLSIAKDAEKPTLEELLEYIEQLRDEAVKEFAEQVKRKALALVWTVDVVNSADYIKCIDNLVKEWVGDNND